MRYLPLKHCRSFVFERPDSFLIDKFRSFSDKRFESFRLNNLHPPQSSNSNPIQLSNSGPSSSSKNMAPNKLKKAQKGKKSESWLEEGIASSSAIERPATTGSSRPSTAASASEIDPARHTVAYRIDIHRIPPRGSSLHATISAPTTPSHSAITLHSFHSEINLGNLPPKLRQSASTKFSLCQELESQNKELKKKPSAGSSPDQGHVRVYEKKLELLEAQHEFLNLQVYIAEQESEKSGKPLSDDQTYLDTTHMRDLVSRIILSTKSFLKDEA